jgi:hypothetical protein
MSVPANGARAAHAKGIALSAGCSGRVRGPPANPPPASDIRFGVLQGVAGARKRPWPSPIQSWCLDPLGSGRGRAMRRRGTIACHPDRRHDHSNARSRRWNASATASPESAWPSGEAGHT